MDSPQDLWIAKAFSTHSQASSEALSTPIYFLMRAQSAQTCEALIRQYVMINSQPVSLPLAPLPLNVFRERHEDIPGVEEVIPQLGEGPCLLSFSVEVAQTPAPTHEDGFLAIEAREYEPLDDQFWVDEDKKRNLPEEWQDWLFPEDGLTTYAIIDPHRDSFWINRFVKDSGLTYRNLYQGLAYEHFEHMAPWLVEIPPNALFLRQFFTYNPDNPQAVFDLWRHQAVIFLRSDKPFDDLHRHLRKFVLQTTHDGDDLYFHYFRAAMLKQYLNHNAQRAGKIAVFFGVPDKMIECFIAPQGKQVLRLSPVHLDESVTPAKIELDEHDLRPMVDSYSRGIFAPIAEQLLTDYPTLGSDYDKEQLIDLLIETRDHQRSFNVVMSRSIMLLQLWALLYGEDWWQGELRREVNATLRDKELSEHHKIHHLHRLIGRLEAQGRQPHYS